MRSALVGLLILVVVACAPKPGLRLTPTVNETSPSFVHSTSASDQLSQPDLTVRFMYLEMEGRQGSCVNAYSPYGIRVQIKNVGSAHAGAFVVDLNGVVQDVKGGLQIGQTIELHFAGTIPSGQYEATADITNQVVESREDNNTSSFHAPTPTPPPLCVPTTTATP